MWKKKCYFVGQNKRATLYILSFHKKMLMCITVHQCFLQSSTAELKWATMPSIDLRGLISCLKAFPLLREVFLSKSHTTQCNQVLDSTGNLQQTRAWIFFFSLQMEPWIGLLRMYVAFNSCEVTMLEKASVFNVFNAQIIYSSFSGGKKPIELSTAFPIKHQIMENNWSLTVLYLFHFLHCLWENH